MDVNDPLNQAVPTKPGSSLKLNHANLCTSDVTSLSNIFTRHFAFEVLQASNEFAMMRGSDSFSLVLTKIDGNSPKEYPNSLMFGLRISFHVGFVVDAQQEVYDKHKELEEAGHNPGPIKTFEALGLSWTAFYCPVGDGIDIEVTHHS